MSNHSKRPVRTYESAAKRLFANGESGVWFDPNDGRTMFTESSNLRQTEAVVNGVVGFMLDKSKNPNLIKGPELLTNGEFDADLSSWTDSSAAGGSVAWSDGMAELTNTTGIPILYQDFTTVADEWYLIEAKNDASSNSNLQIYVDGITGVINITAGQFAKVFFQATTTTHRVTIRNANPGVVNVDFVRIGSMPGNHADQATTASKPILREDSAGHRYLETDGIDDSLVATNSSGNVWLPPSSVCVAITADTSGHGNIIDSETVRHQVGIRDVTGTMKWEIYGGQIQYADASTNIGAFPTDKTIITGEFDATAATVSVDGVRITGGSSGTQGIPADGDFYIARNPLYASEAWDGAIYQIIYVNRAITAEERDLLETRVYKNAGVTP